MKSVNAGKKSLGIAIILFIFFLSFQVTAAELSFTLTTGDVHEAPWLIGNSTEIQPNPGMGPELWQRAAKQSGLKIKILRMPSLRILSELEKGTTDAAAGFSYREDRAKFAAYPMKDGKPDPSKRVMSFRYHVYRLKGTQVNWDGKKFSNLKGPVGVRLGTSIADDLKKMGIEVDTVKSPIQNLDKLARGRIEAIVGGQEQMDHLISQRNYKNIEKLPRPVVEKAYYLIFNKEFMKKNPAAAEKIWAKIGELRDKTYAELLPKYGSFLEE